MDPRSTVRFRVSDQNVTAGATWAVFAADTSAGKSTLHPAVTLLALGAVRAPAPQHGEPRFSLGIGHWFRTGNVLPSGRLAGAMANPCKFSSGAGFLEGSSPPAAP